MPGARTLALAAVALLGVSVAGCDSGGGFADLHHSGSGFYGVNLDEQGVREFAGADVERLLSRLDPATLRWPGGEDANYFDWRTEPGSAPDAATRALQDLAVAYQTTGATPIFVLNVLAAANRVDTGDQLAMLTAARGLGLPVKYVELGNELYAGGEFAQAFPSGAAYGLTVARYVRALHAAFPGVEVAADACLQPATARQQSWNAGLLATATGSGAPDALTLHDYPGLVIHPFTRADPPALFANAYQAIDQLDAVVRSLGGRPVWLTEYNFHGPYQQSSPNPVQTS
jgi:Alpha-L-arabinofuranosidase